jgi:hypothetical protein
MITWKLLTDDEARQSWDDALIRFSDCAPFQTHAWGEYRRALHWEQCRWIAVDDQGEPVAMLQASLRRYPFGVGLLWCEGGPVGDLSACGDTLQQAIKDTTGLKQVYCRFRCDRERNIEDALRLTAQGWTLPWAPLTTCYSMILSLPSEEDRLLAACDRNFRRNLRRAHESELKATQWLDPTADDVFAVYDSMQNAKGLDEQLSREEIEFILKNLKQQLVLYRCQDAKGETLTLLGCLVIGERACCVLSATSEAGRGLNSSYAVFWELFRHCQRIGVKSLDLAGIDPIRNHGVYRFKRATGATPIEYLGEWDWASRPAMRWFGNWAIDRRDLLKRVSATLATTRIVVKTPAKLVATGVRAALTLLLVTAGSID